MYLSPPPVHLQYNKFFWMSAKFLLFFSPYLFFFHRCLINSYCFYLGADGMRGEFRWRTDKSAVPPPPLLPPLPPPPPSELPLFVPPAPGGVTPLCARASSVRSKRPPFFGAGVVLRAARPRCVVVYPVNFHGCEAFVGI